MSGLSYGGPINNGTYSDFTPKSIVHVALYVDTSSGDIEYSTGRSDVPVTDPGNATIENYARSVAMKLTPPPPPPNATGAKNLIPQPSQFDITITDQCWVLIQLDPRRSKWRFQSGARGATVKMSNTQYDNINLQHVYDNGDIEYAGNSVDVRKNCQVLFFSVYKRGKYDTDEGHSFLNILTEVIAKDGKVLQTTYDPDVPNDGDPFP